MEVKEEKLTRAMRILARAVARERVENYALRVLLTDSADPDASIDIQRKARELAAKRYDKLLRLVEYDEGEPVELMSFLERFENLMRRE